MTTQVGTGTCASLIAAEGGVYGLPYDQLVVALGASTNDGLIPGSSNALTFKTMADALVLRNHLLERFERADATADLTQRCECLTVVVIGGGLVGVELVGELIRVRSRGSSACGSRVFSPGGSVGRITSFRCPAGTGDCALSWTGRWPSSSGPTSRGLICAWSESRCSRRANY